MSDKCECGFDHWPLPCKSEDVEYRKAHSSFAAPSGSASFSGAEATDLKMKLNQLIWEYAPAETTIGEAEELACKIFNSVRKGKYLT